MTHAPGPTRRWTPAHSVLAVGFVALAFYATRDAWADIYYIGATDEESSHIFLVPVVAAWMFFARRLRLRSCPPGPSLIGPLLVGLGWLVHAFGYANQVQAAWHAGALAIVLGALLTIIGHSVLFRFLPAFAVLAFLVPVPAVIRQAVAMPLQTATAAITHALFETAGLEVARSGNVLTINGVDVAVAEACNGMRMVFALILVSYAFAFSMPLRNGVRLLVLLASPLAAIACNVLRLVPTIWLYGYSSKSFADSFHTWSGWLMLPIAFLLLLALERALRWALIPVARFNLAYQ